MILIYKSSIFYFFTLDKLPFFIFLVDYSILYFIISVLILFVIVEI